MKYLRTKITIIILIGILLSNIINLASAQSTASLRSIISLDGSDWQLIGLPMGQGEQTGINKNSESDELIQTSVPNNVQLAIGLKDPYSQDKEMVEINKKEWWYVRTFDSPKIGKHQQVRLDFDGVDYFADVWLNGKKLGSHEGAFTAFDFNISEHLKSKSPNYLAVRVTAPWKVEGRGHYEFMKGEYEETWDAFPGPGQVLFPLGLHRSVNLKIVPKTRVESVQIITAAIEENSADLKIEVSVIGSNKAKKYKLKLTLIPENFKGEAFDLPEQELSFSAKDSKSQFIDLTTTVKNPKLWWTWDMGEQNLYKAQAIIYDASGNEVDSFTTIFGIRTFERNHNFLYSLNGKPIYLKGSWTPLSTAFPAEPDRWVYEKDLRQAIHANMNHLVNFTVVEKKEFYDLANRLGMLIFVELPFNQLGPLDAIDTKNPRFNEYMEWCSGEVRQIIRDLANNPSIGLWSAVAEVTSDGHEFSFEASWDFRIREAGDGYAIFLNTMEELVIESDADALYQRSLCDFGEMHFWDGGLWGTYELNFTNETNFVSEYGGMAFPPYETVSKIIDTDEIWNSKHNTWSALNLPIDLGEMSYLTGFSYGGLALVSDYIYTNVDRQPRSLKEFTDATQIYQNFIYGYSGDAYRRKLFEPINGVRSWSFKSFSEKPLCSFGVVDSKNTALPSYYTQKRTYNSVSMSFAVQYALESVIAETKWNVPIWLSNATNESVSGNIEAVLYNLKGDTVQYYTNKASINSMNAEAVYKLEIPLPSESGIYLLGGNFSNDKNDIAETEMYVKVVPKVTSKSPRILVIGTPYWVTPVRDYLANLGADIKTIIYEPTVIRSPEIPFPESVEQLLNQYDAVWLAGFDNFWREAPEPWSEIIVKAVEDGMTFIHTGSWSSFHGGEIDRTAAIDLTPLADILPVEVKAKNDVLAIHNLTWVEGGSLLVDPAKEVKPKDKIKATAMAPNWLKDVKFPEVELNRHVLKPKTGAKVLLNINEQPLLVTGNYGKGNVIAYLGFSPTYDDFTKDTTIFDRILKTSVEHLIFASVSASILALIVEEDPILPIKDLLDTRTKPLFETLKNVSKPDWPEVNLTWIKTDDGIHRAKIQIQNGATFFRGLRLRLDGSDFESGKALPLWSNQYFDLLPNEIVECTVEIKMEDKQDLGKVVLVGDILQGSESVNYSVTPLY